MNYDHNNHGYSIDIDNIISGIIKSSLFSNQVWSRLQYLETLLEDLQEDLQIVISKLQQIKEKFEVLKDVFGVISKLYTEEFISYELELLGCVTIVNLILPI